MAKWIFSLLIILSGTSIIVSTAYSQAEKKTVTLPSSETVCDLNGEWKALYAHYGAMQWVGDIESTVKIIQQGNMFIATSLTATGFTPAGTEKIRGELDEGGIKNVRYNRPDLGWLNAKGELSKDCNKIVIDDGNGVKTMLDRK